MLLAAMLPALAAPSLMGKLPPIMCLAATLRSLCVTVLSHAFFILAQAFIPSDAAKWLITALCIWLLSYLARLTMLPQVDDKLMPICAFAMIFCINEAGIFAPSAAYCTAYFISALFTYLRD